MDYMNAELQRIEKDNAKIEKKIEAVNMRAVEIDREIEEKLAKRRDDTAEALKGQKNAKKVAEEEVQKLRT